MIGNCNLEQPTGFVNRLSSQIYFEPVYAKSFTISHAIRNTSYEVCVTGNKYIISNPLTVSIINNYNSCLQYIYILMCQVFLK